MYLKSLTLHGFKSFADKTHLEFSTGVTGIVGPNGCGKSNVVDAIRWVLGETSAKALRGSEMADVIFNGTDKRKPVGMAEVTLTMAECEGVLNVDYNEVSITRRVFRDGKGEYRLNGTVCRLRDIHELFAGTGIGRTAYSIMAQGQIDMLLSSKPEDRRSVFEEAAGITKFKGQKREALRKVEYTDANLLRINDIIAEVKRQTASVQRQAQKARRYQMLVSDMRTLDTHLGHRQFTELHTERTTAQEQLRELLLQMHEAHQDQQRTEREAAEAREQYQAIDAHINTLRHQSQELRTQLQAAESRIGFNRERCEELEMRIRKNEEDLENSRDLIDQATTEMATASEQLLFIQTNIEGRQLALNEHQTSQTDLVPERSRIDHERRRLREKVRMCEGQIAASESKQQTLTEQISADRQRLELLARDSQSATSTKDAAQLEHDDLQRQITEIEGARHELEEKLKHTAASIQEQRRQRDLRDHELLEIQRIITQKRSRLEAIQQLLATGEGLQAGTQHILRGLDNPEVYLTGVRGLLANSIEVEPEYITAIEAALRENLQAVLLTQSELAETLVQRLMDQKLGRAAILPADFVSGSNSHRKSLPQGALAWATSKVKVKSSGHEAQSKTEVIQHLLSHVVLTNELGQALQIKRSHPELAVVTLGGEFINREGVIHGGCTHEQGASTLRREAEVRDLQTELEALQIRLSEKEQQVQTHRTEIEELQHEEASQREHSQQCREELSLFSGRFSVVQRSLQQAASKADSIIWEEQQIQRRITEADAQIILLREQVQTAKEQLEISHEEELELEVEAETLGRRELESAEQHNELRTALALEQSALISLERQKAPMATRLSELNGTMQRYQSEVITWRERITSAHEENDRLTEEAESHRQTLAEVEEQGATTLDQRISTQERVQLLESQLQGLRQRSSETTELRSKNEVKLTKADMRLESLTAQLQERYQLDISEFTADYRALLDAIEQQRKLRMRSDKRRAAGEEPSEDDLDLPKRRKAKKAKEDAITQIEGAIVISTDAEANAESEEVTIVTDAEESAEEVVFTIEDATDEEGNPIEATETEEVTSEVPAEVIELSDDDWAFVTEIVSELRQRLDSIGPVNLDAIQEFEELEERYKFLETQHADLIRSKDELLQVIAKINDTTKQMFSSTFAQVRTFFQNNFRELFGAQAKADLVLVDEDDPLESGIEIIAKPPGKKLQTISLLSGGERSMTAVALLFSIYQVKPSPFCVLDELDAPLDESNISRFLSMLDKFVVNSQFIVVTHNKRTMNRADVIYGVTMQEFGVSKPVGVRMTAQATSLYTQRGIGRVAIDEDGTQHVDTLPSGSAVTSQPPATEPAAKPTVLEDEFSDLTQDSEQAAAAAERPARDLTEPEDVLATLAASERESAVIEEEEVVFNIDADHEDEVGLSA